jgi:hypothetical protein
MKERKRSGTEISLNRVYGLLKVSGVPEDESVEFLKLPWIRNPDRKYEAFPVLEEKDYSTETLRTQRMFFEDAKEMIRIATIFKKFYGKRLVRNVREFNDFWVYANGSAVRMEELASELENIAHAYEVYKGAFEEERQQQSARRNGILKEKSRKDLQCPMLLESRDNMTENIVRKGLN